MMIYPYEVSDIRPILTLVPVKKNESILALVTADSPHPTYQHHLHLKRSRTGFSVVPLLPLSITSSYLFAIYTPCYNTALEITPSCFGS